MEPLPEQPAVPVQVPRVAAAPAPEVVRRDLLGLDAARAELLGVQTRDVAEAAAVDGDLRAGFAEAGAEVRLVEEVGERQLLADEQVSKLSLAASLDGRQRESGSTGLDSIAQTGQDEVSYVADAARVVVADENQSWSPPLVLAADAGQRPRDKGNVWGGEVGVDAAATLFMVSM